MTNLTLQRIEQRQQFENDLWSFVTGTYEPLTFVTYAYNVLAFGDPKGES